MARYAWSRLRVSSRCEFAFANRGTCSRNRASRFFMKRANEATALTAAPH